MDSPFRLASLATHPLSGGGQEKWRRGAINPKPCLFCLQGEGGPRLYLKSCLFCLSGAGDHVSTSNLASPCLQGEGDHEVVEGVAAPSGRCLRSGHKNSVKGKGAIKHKGAPTIIYHCTDSPFRLAPLATHPLSGGGQEKDGCPLPSRSTRHPPP